MKKVRPFMPPENAYHQCVFAVAESLCATHGQQATFRAADYALQSIDNAQEFGSAFWRDVIRAIEAVDGDSNGIAVN